MIGKIQSNVSFKQLYAEDRETREGIKQLAKNPQLREIFYKGCKIINETSNKFRTDVKFSIRQGVTPDYVGLTINGGDMYETIYLNGSNSDTLKGSMRALLGNIFDSQQPQYIRKFEDAMKKSPNSLPKDGDKFLQRLEKDCVVKFKKS